MYLSVDGTLFSLSFCPQWRKGFSEKEEPKAQHEYFITKHSQRDESGFQVR